MGKLIDKLQRQLNTGYKQDAEDCIKIYNKLLNIHNGHVWESNWTPLVQTILEASTGYKRNKRYKPTAIGYLFLKGIS